MQYTSAVIALLASAGLAQAGVVKARADCQAQADACRVAPGANQSFCSAQLSSCLGYNPYANNTAAATTPVVRYTTVIQSSYVTYCPSPTTIVQGTQTYTVTAATTLTITNCPCTVTKAVPEATGVATPSTCAATCQAQYDTCRVGTPGMSGNQASCLAAFSQCLGFVPTNAAGQFTSPTACATSAAGTRAATTAPAATTSAAANACVSSCQATYNTCRVGTPGMSGNQASCLAAYASCLGFLPTNAAGSLTSPTACSTTAAASTAAGRTSTVALTTTVRPAATVGVPVCQIGDGQIQNSGACTTVPGSSSTVVIPATTMTVPVVVSTARASTTAPVASVPAASNPAASVPVSSSTRSVQTVAASTTRPVTQFTGAASVEKPVYGLLAMGAFAALL